MNLLITGACGYIGHALLKALEPHAEKFSKVILYDNFARKNNGFFLGEHFGNLPVKLCQGNILDNRKLKKELAEVDTVVHMAGRVTTPYADHNAQEFEQVNHWGTACLVDAVDQSPTVQRIIYLSTVSVYGSSDREIDESESPDPKSFYGVSKWRAEQQIHRVSDRVRWNILRAGNVYGYNPSMRLEAVINKFMFEAHHLGQITVNGDGHQCRAFVSIYQVAKSIKDQILREFEESATLNVVERSLTINEVIGEMEKIYPHLDKIYINQNMPMRSVRIKETVKSERSFLDQLKHLEAHFSL